MKYEFVEIGIIGCGVRIRDLLSHLPGLVVDLVSTWKELDRL